jgi:acyl carrier protein phosphodiesterase
MIQQDWLTSYQQISGVEAAIARIARRSKRGDILANSIVELKAHYPEFELGFEIYFPELVGYVEQEEFNQINKLLNYLPFGGL